MMGNRMNQKGGDLETGEVKAPQNHQEWESQGYNLLTPESYQLYRQNTLNLVNRQKQTIQKEVHQKSGSWLSTLDGWMRGGFQAREWNLYPAQDQEGGGSMKGVYDELERARKGWLSARRQWENHWSQLVKKVRLQQSGGSQDGGMVEVVGKKWLDFQNEEAKLDCQYRWNDKIRFFVIEFLDNESRDFRHYIANQHSPSNQLQEYKWEQPWIERRMNYLRDRIQDMAEQRDTYRDPKWMPVGERLRGPRGWEECWNRMRRWDGSQWVQNYISPQDYAQWLRQEDIQFWKRSLALWKSWGRGQEVPWTVQAWWFWFLLPSPEQENDVWRGWNTMREVLQSALENGLQARTAQRIEKVLEETKGVEDLHEPFAQQEWILRVGPHILQAFEEIPVEDRRRVVSTEEIEHAARRDAALQWIGWKGWWRGPEITMRDFMEQIQVYNERVASEANREKWETMDVYGCVENENE